MSYEVVAIGAEVDDATPSSVVVEPVETRRVVEPVETPRSLGKVDAHVAPVSWVGHNG
jgi:hypothetical protein